MAPEKENPWKFGESNWKPSFFGVYDSMFVFEGVYQIIYGRNRREFLNGVAVSGAFPPGCLFGTRSS